MSTTTTIQIQVTCPDDIHPLEWDRQVRRIVFNAMITPRLILGTRVKVVEE